MQGRMQAMIAASSFAVLSMLFPPVSMVSSAAVALVTLRRGASEGLYVLGCATLAAGAFGFFAQGTWQFVLMCLVLWLPIWLISVILREGRHLALAIEIAIFLGILGVIGVYGLISNPTILWQQFLIQLTPPNASAENTQRTIALLSQYMTGVVAAGTVASLLFSLFLARWWQATLYNPGGFKQEFLWLTARPRITLATWILIGIAFAGLGNVSTIAVNLFLVISVLYIYVGIAVLHSICASKQLAKYMVPMLYVTMFLIPHSLIVIALVGLTDMWLNLRKK